MRVRDYREADAPAVGRLIAATFGGINLVDFPEAQRTAILGPFAHADSPDLEHRRAIAAVLESEFVLVAEEGPAIVGVLRGRMGRLASLFVDASRHRRGIATALVQRFEDLVRENGGGIVKVSSTVTAVPFYESVGYRKTTGVRSMRSFGGEGLPYQPMKKAVPR